MAKAAIQNAEVAKREPLSEDELMGVLAREMKVRKESHGEFERGGRPELAAKEADAIEVLARYLPAQLSEDEIRQIVMQAVGDLGGDLTANPRAAMGAVMKVVMPKVQGQADGSAVTAIVRSALAL
jgi:hypothetical protein